MKNNFKYFKMKIQIQLKNTPDKLIDKVNNKSDIIKKNKKKEKKVDA